LVNHLKGIFAPVFYIDQSILPSHSRNIHLD
jgi:hypothetical protein